MQYNFIDMVGKKIGRLLITERGANSKKGQARWRCLCECGKETVVQGFDLRSGNTVSCGCFQTETITRQHTRSVKHGHASKTNRHPLYGVWKNRRAQGKTTQEFLEFIQQQN